ncbi:Cytochrome P450 monooxygenase [Lachnellula subtilissima]|uniref:Cytochrome P450 monooxygenase n=1 Tax=Lachnellula subtilissima TaxID=602034 RepID=A0A8H8U6D1_9HELO|nr:Cytochrome P450 monooxygenase [Lachnellula subtilissima]
MDHTSGTSGTQSLLEVAWQACNETFTNFKMRHGALAMTSPFTVSHICMSIGIILWRVWHTMNGRSHRVIEKQHKIYGSVFRVSPNELSFASASSWKAIYGTPVAGKEQLIKSEFYDMYGSGFKTGCIGSERNPQEHAQKKRDLSAAFSTKSLSQQEKIIQRCIDGFITKIGDCSSKSADGINMVKWYEMVAFDAMGEMAFGESFHCIEKGTSPVDGSHSGSYVGNYFCGQSPSIRALGCDWKYVAPWLTVSARDQHTKYSRTKVQERLRTKSSRKDFLTNLVEKVDRNEVSREQLTAHSSTIIIAGGETVSTFLAAATYYLLKTPSAYEKLKLEVRGRFQSYEDIDSTAVLQLPYLQAVIQEGLRIHPPGSQGFPRLSPGTQIDGYWVPKGTEVYTSAWTVTHDEAYFSDPMTFKPERWIDPKSTDRKDASQPFSLGLRGCLGRNFALMEMSLILAKIIYVYDMELVEKDLDWEGTSSVFVMWWKAAMKVRFERRI